MSKVSIHGHFKSEFDAVAPIADMLQAYVNQGYDTIAITDHRSVTALPDVYELVQNEESPFHDLHIIYGVEANVELANIPVKTKSGHLIMLAMNEAGKHAIDKMISKAPIVKNEPVFTREFLEEWQLKFKGNVIATSACIAGAPAMAFKTNVFFEREINHLEKMKTQALTSLVKELKSAEYDGVLADYTEFTEDEYIKLADTLSRENENYKQNFDSIVNQVVELRATKKALNKLVKKSFVLMEKKLAKLKDLDKLSGRDTASPETQQAEAELIAAKEKSANAAAELDVVSEKIDTLWKERGILKTVINSYSKFYDKIEEIDTHISTCQESMCSIEECRENAKAEMKYFDNLFGHNRYFVELQNHEIEDELSIYPELAKLAISLHIPLVVSNDSHIPSKDQKWLDQRQVAKFLRFGNKVSTPEEELADAELYVKSQDEIREAVLKLFEKDGKLLDGAEKIVDTAINNTNKIAQLCTYVPKRENHYPVFDKTKDSNELLRQFTYEGAKWRFPEGLTQEYKDRLEYELDVICKMGYADYHLIVKDFLEYARACGPIPLGYLDAAPLDIDGVKQYCEEHNWTVGIGTGWGRGSAGGSLVCYCLGIVNVDPIPYGLIFERFLNIERVSMPDIDSDFRPDIREKTIQYVQKLYGHGAVVSILTESRQGVKGAIRDAARYLGQKKFDDPNQCLALGNMIRKKVDNIVGLTFDTPTTLEDGTEVSYYEYLCDVFANDSMALQVLELAYHVEGAFTSFGMHAAGVIIPDTDDITDYIALRWNAAKERYTTQCNMVQAESAEGLLKMDFLGLKNLAIFTEAAQMIEKTDGVQIDFDHIPFEDVVFKEIYAKGRTKNVFQFESPGMRKYLKELDPSNIEDIVAMNALYRPGPMNFIGEFIASKHIEDAKKASA